MLLAGMVLLAAMAPILFLFPSGARQTAFSVTKLEAHLRAETLLALALDRAVREGPGGLQAGVDLQVGLVRNRGESVRLDPVPGFPGLWQLTAEVDWFSPLDPERRPRTYTLRRLVHRPEQGLTGRWILGT